MRKISNKMVCAMVALVAQFPAFAQDRACLIEGSLVLLGQTTEIKDCLQNDGAPQESFLESCNGIANAAAALGAPPSKVTYMASCPAQAQASCEGLLGAQMTAYYYKRDAESLAATKQSCAAQGGKWNGVSP